MTRTRSLARHRGERVHLGISESLAAGPRGLTVLDATKTAHPVRRIQFLGNTITWDDETHTVIVTAGDSEGDPTPPGGYDLTPYYDTVTIVAAAGATETLDLSAGKFFYIVLTANLTLSFVNPPESGPLHQYLIALVQGGTGSYTVTWPSNVSGADTDGTPTAFAPTLFTAVGGQNDVILSTQDGGATYGASILGASGSGGVTGFATPAIALGTAAAVGAATTVIRSDATIVAFDATVPATQAFGDAAATGAAAVAARRDHTHGMPAAPSTGGGHILLADGHATPFAFTDLLQADDGSDFLWSD